jgi:hypothetical protein
MVRWAVVFLLTPLLGHLASAKRIAPVSVDPVIYQGIRYVAPNDNGRRGYIEAWNVGTNKKLWELTIFSSRIDPKLEEDVQWVFINALSVQDGRLIATSEDGKSYQVDLKTKAIRQSTSESPASPGATPEVMTEVTKSLTKGSAAKRYDISYRINPHYLEGDFNGDGKADVAVLLKERSTGKIGIGILHGATGKLTVFGAGIVIGNGGDDFEWMDSWRVYFKTDAAYSAGKISIKNLRGDALVVEKNESGSALIYWNGKRYVWHQQSD